LSGNLDAQNRRYAFEREGAGDDGAVGALAMDAFDARAQRGLPENVLMLVCQQLTNG